jgi:hypothetical protein
LILEILAFIAGNEGTGELEKMQGRSLFDAKVVETLVVAMMHLNVLNEEKQFVSILTSGVSKTGN